MLDPARYEQTLQQLTRAPHRQTGTDEGRQAGDYLLEQLRGLGAGEVFVQRFPVPVEVVHQCELRAASGVLPLQPLRANGLQSAVTPVGGITGPVVYIGQATPTELAGKNLDGALVVAELTADDILWQAARLGARAVIFIGSDRVTAHDLENKRTFVNVSLPRFYVSAAAAEKFGLRQLDRAALISQIEWEPREGRNLYLWLPPRHGEGRSPEMVILSCRYDSAGLVPLNCPAPETAANCAALLETARRIAGAADRECGVLIAFFDGSFNYQEGARRFYADLRLSQDRGLVRRGDAYEAERKYIESLRDFLRRNPRDLYGAPHPLQDAGLLRLADEAKRQYGEVQRDLTTARLELDRRRLAREDFTAVQAESDRLAAKLKEWQAVRESLRDRTAVDPIGEKAFAKNIAALQDWTGSRLKELSVLSGYQQESLALMNRLAGVTPVMHVAYQFSGGTENWLYLPHTDVHVRLYTHWADAVHQSAPPAHVIWEGLKEARLARPNLYSYRFDEAEFAVQFDIPSVSLVTADDLAEHWGVPDATPDPEQAARILRQSAEFLPFLKALLSGDLASVANRMTYARQYVIDEPVWQDGQPQGHRVLSFAYGETAASQMEPNILVHAMAATSTTPPAGEYCVYADAYGLFPLTPILSSDWRSMWLEAARFDGQGRIAAITTAPVSGGSATAGVMWQNVRTFRPYLASNLYSILCLIRGASGEIAGANLPFSEAFEPNLFELLNGLSNGPYPLAHFRFDPQTGLGFYHIEEPFGIKLIYQHPKRHQEVALLIHSTDKIPGGIGYGPGAGTGLATGTCTVLDLRGQMSADLFRLNESRLNVLRSKNIILNDIEFVHAQSAGIQNQTAAAVAANHHQEAYQLASLSAAWEERLYGRIVSITNDLMVAVTMLLLLALPFAAALQSLLTPTYDIYRRIGWFALFFLGTFGVLYLVHPAFSFAALPLMIILAFLILVMSASVIWIIGSRFRYEVHKMQGLAMGAHTFEQRTVGNLGAAISLAIASMRRRPARTALTIITVLLLTFTIVSFVSFQGEQGVSRHYLGAGDETPRLLLHRRVWKKMDPHVLDEYRSHFGPAYDVHGRYWLVQELRADSLLDELQVAIATARGKRSTASAIMTVDPIEIARIPGVTGLLDGDQAAFERGEGVFLSPRLAGELGLQPGDELRVRGLAVKFLGAFNPRALMEMRQEDGAPFLPIDFRLTQQAIGHFESKGSNGGDTDPLADMEDQLAGLGTEVMEPVSADVVVIAPTALARRLGLSLEAVVAYPRTDMDLEAAARQTALLQDDGVYANQGGERHFYSFGDKLEVGGRWDVVVPLLLGGLIVFSTMLGSMIDREKEIYTFSALGLSGRNIAMLFFVEAGVYAVVGGFGGYLFSQAATWLLEVVARFGWFRAPELNYSSSTAIYTMLLVMGTVIISTIYPAWRAAQKATADTASQWRVPAPRGDLLSFDFPFTISRYDISGVVCFLREYLATHADRTVGQFAVSDLEVFREPLHGMLGLRAQVWLQPFDEGVSQRFELTAHPSKIEEVCEIHLRLERVSGPPLSWRRSNVGFLNRLRQQFLLWRTLDDDVMALYLAQADETAATEVALHA
jgi:hypothetical protein